MKRKPNKPRPEAQTHTEPGNGAAEPGGSALELALNRSPGRLALRSGVSENSKFRQKSQQEQAAASKLRMEKRGEKREAAREKLAKQKPPKQKGPIRKAAGAAGWGVHGFVHGKLYEVEQENVGTEGAHRSELAGEVVLRHGSRFVKRKVREHPARAASRAEARYRKSGSEYHFHTAAQEHPELSKNYFTRYWQKQRLRRQYQKRAKEAAKQGAKAAGKTAAATEKLTARAAGFVKRHPVGCLLALACVLVIVLLQSCSSSLVSIGNAETGALGATTYPSEDEAILGAEAAYAGLEAELQTYLDTYESTHDYDEYHFNLDEIEHDPYVLISLLSALHEGEWTLSQVEGSLQMLFDRQYILTERVEVETRYDSDDEPYSWYICYVTLENKNLSHLPVSLLSEEQMSRYSIYMSTLGNRPDLFPDSPYVDKYITNPPEGYEVPGEYLDDETFAAIFSEAEKYIGYPYVWGGSSPSTSFDCSGYVSWVINHPAGMWAAPWGAGALQHLHPDQLPKARRLLFQKGTYDTPGREPLWDLCRRWAVMLHCGDPIGYANLNTSYWQSHFTPTGVYHDWRSFMATGKKHEIQAEIDKVKAKMSEQQARLKELEQKKLEAENSEIVDIVRGMSIPFCEVPLLFEKLKGGGALGQSVPKSEDEEKEEN